MHATKNANSVCPVDAICKIGAKIVCLATRFLEGSYGGTGGTPKRKIRKSVLRKIRQRKKIQGRNLNLLCNLIPAYPKCKFIMEPPTPSRLLFPTPLKYDFFLALTALACITELFLLVLPSTSEKKRWDAILVAAAHATAARDRGTKSAQSFLVKKS